MPLGPTRGLRRALVLLVLILVPVVTVQSAADAAEPTTLGLSGSPASADEPTTLEATLTTATGVPLGGAVVTIERRVGGVWAALASATTDAAGRARATAVLGRDPADNAFRASYAGDATHAPSTSAEVQVPLVRRASRVRIGGPRDVVDERPVTLRFTWRTQDGVPVSGPVAVLRRSAGDRWRTVARLTTDGAGAASLTTTPRQDTRWKVRTAQLPWVDRDTSAVHEVDNLPPAPPVDLPGRAPSPRVGLPPQPRAVGEGAHPVITPIPDDVWRTMTGRSWHAGCPVGRPRLRLLRINYWDYGGYRRRGELVAAAGAVEQMARALTAMYARELPIRSMYRVDRFGWSRRLQGADDYGSMASGNTSAFNCRHVVGRPGVRSPHSYGRSLDLNPWENPYRSATGLVPNAWWQARSHPRVAWRSRGHAVVRLLARHGLRWTYGLSDTQHFDAVGRAGKVLIPRGCSPSTVCR